MRPYYVQIRNQKQEVIEELIDYLALDDMIITEPEELGKKWDKE